MKFHTCSFVENTTKENRIAGQTYQKTNSIDSKEEKKKRRKCTNTRKKEGICFQLFPIFTFLFAFPLFYFHLCLDIPPYSSTIFVFFFCSFYKVIYYKYSENKKKLQRIAEMILQSPYNIKKKLNQDFLNNELICDSFI